MFHIFTLIDACAFIFQDAVTLLIQYNADVTIINGEGRKPSQVTNSREVKQLIKG